jgi:predicted Zn-dependent peptidase
MTGPTDRIRRSTLPNGLRVVTDELAAAEEVESRFGDKDTGEEPARTATRSHR